MWHLLAIANSRNENLNYSYIINQMCQAKSRVTCIHIRAAEEAVIMLVQNLSLQMRTQTLKIQEEVVGMGVEVIVPEVVAEE